MIDYMPQFLSNLHYGCASFNHTNFNLTVGLNYPYSYPYQSNMDLRYSQVETTFQSNIDIKVSQVSL